MGHSQEPWVGVGEGETLNIVGSDGRLVGTVVVNGGGSAKQVANLNRIIDCVNGCGGFYPVDGSWSKAGKLVENPAALVLLTTMAGVALDFLDELADKGLTASQKKQRDDLILGLDKTMNTLARKKE